MIIVENLTKRFSGVAAVDQLSLRVEAGELFALLGPNGAGKTTTINCLLGFLSPDSGRLAIAGVDIVNDPGGARRHVAYIPEQVSLYGNFTAVENLDYFSTLTGHKYGDPQLRGYLSETGLESAVHDVRLRNYSKGMRQKVGIAIALARRAKVLLLDEPTSGLDPSAAHEFSTLLQSLRERGVAILMATHDLFRASEDASRVGIMCKGRLAQTVSRADLQRIDLERLYLDTLRNSTADAAKSAVSPAVSNP